MTNQGAARRQIIYFNLFAIENRVERPFLSIKLSTLPFIPPPRQVSICTDVGRFRFPRRPAATTAAALSAASIFLKVSSHNSSASSLRPIVRQHKGLFVRCATVTRGPGCQRQQRDGGSLCLATGVWSKGKGRRSGTGPPLRESPLSTALYIAGRVPVFPITAC